MGSHPISRNEVHLIGHYIRREADRSAIVQAFRETGDIDFANGRHDSGSATGAKIVHARRLTVGRRGERERHDCGGCKNELHRFSPCVASIEASHLYYTPTGQGQNGGLKAQLAALAGAPRPTVGPVTHLPTSRRFQLTKPLSGPHRHVARYCGGSGGVGERKLSARACDRYRTGPPRVAARYCCIPSSVVDFRPECVSALRAHWTAVITSDSLFF
jgi:hypothetical protein